MSEPHETRFRVFRFRVIFIFIYFYFFFLGGGGAGGLKFRASGVEGLQAP